MLAATFTTAIVFFPVVFLYGVSKYLFTALALGVVLALGRLLPGRDDRRAAVLREVHQDGAWPRRTSGNQIAVRKVRGRIQPPLQPHAGQV